jgi:hypothetical protein
MGRRQGSCHPEKFENAGRYFWRGDDVKQGRGAFQTAHRFQTAVCKPPLEASKRAATWLMIHPFSPKNGYLIFNELQIVSAALVELHLIDIVYLSHYAVSLELTELDV